MVYLEDQGSVFNAPIDVVWKDIFGGGDHDKVHTSTRNSEFKNVSDCTILYIAERAYGAKWKKETMRISFFPPVAIVQELLDGPLAGSKWTYVVLSEGKEDSDQCLRGIQVEVPAEGATDEGRARLLGEGVRRRRPGGREDGPRQVGVPARP